MRVLIAEDECAAGVAMAKYLELQGHLVRVAADGRAALEQAASFRPDVLVADWRLGHEMDGVALARDMQRHWPHLLTILISAYPKTSLQSAAKGLDNTKILPKPLQLSDLANLIVSCRPA
jgi:DNA-binding response OmpR family regulator